MVTIVYIDDDRDDLDFFEEVIRYINPNYTVFCFDQSSEAITFLEKSTTLPSIIFIDINMPKFSGKETLQLIRQKKNYNSVPIVMYSTTINDSAKKVLMNSGANAFLKKGYSMQSSIAEIERTLNENLN